MFVVLLFILVIIVFVLINVGLVMFWVIMIYGIRLIDFGCVWLVVCVLGLLVLLNLIRLKVEVVLGDILFVFVVLLVVVMFNVLLLIVGGDVYVVFLWVFIDLVICCIVFWINLLIGCLFWIVVKKIWVFFGWFIKLGMVKFVLLLFGFYCYYFLVVWLGL